MVLYSSLCKREDAADRLTRDNADISLVLAHLSSSPHKSETAIKRSLHSRTLCASSCMISISFSPGLLEYSVH